MGSAPSLMVITSLLEYVTKITNNKQVIDDKIKKIQNSVEQITLSQAISGSNIDQQMSATLSQLTTIQSQLETNISNFIKALQQNIEDRQLVDQEQAVKLTEAIQTMTESITPR